MAKLVVLIEAEEKRGRGVSESDPVRIVMQWFTLGGKLVVEKDPHGGGCINCHAPLAANAVRGVFGLVGPFCKYCFDHVRECAKELPEIIP
jgi:hypothetical protein